MWHVVQAAGGPSQQLLQVFLEAVCSDASIGLAMSQLQRYHNSATDLAYDRLLHRIASGLQHAPVVHVQCLGNSAATALWVRKCCP